MTQKWTLAIDYYTYGICNMNGSLNNELYRVKHTKEKTQIKTMNNCRDNFRSLEFPISNPHGTIPTNTSPERNHDSRISLRKMY